MKKSNLMRNFVLVLALFLFANTSILASDEIAESKINAASDKLLRDLSSHLLETTMDSRKAPSFDQVSEYISEKLPNISVEFRLTSSEYKSLLISLADGKSDFFIHYKDLPKGKDTKKEKRHVSLIKEYKQEFRKLIEIRSFVILLSEFHSQISHTEWEDVLRIFIEKFIRDYLAQLGQVKLSDLFR